MSLCRYTVFIGMRAVPVRACIPSQALTARMTRCRWPMAMAPYSSKKDDHPTSEWTRPEPISNPFSPPTSRPSFSHFMNQQTTPFNTPFKDTSSSPPSSPSSSTSVTHKGSTPSTGSSAEPIHVVVTEPNFKQQLWRTFRFLLALGAGYGLLYFIVTREEFARRAGIHIEVQSDTSKRKVSFDDVQGVDEAKAELEEIVEFLRNPAAFTRLGGKLPRGLLLTGPPGTGKTLLAKAIAGEAGVPFFYCSGSEFDEMYVGVGARRVRELFSAAKKKAPCIIFIDEIDAIGSRRHAKDRDYAKMTLNQLLVELDGFTTNEGVIVIGATNFPESLDKALIRPGRFDRHIVVPLPDLRGRRAILALYTRRVPLALEVSLDTIAKGTPGFSGAELENLVNLACIRASVRQADMVELVDLEFAKDRIVMGAERKTWMTPKNRHLVACHESGHALVAWYTPHADPVHKATIMPRGQALGMVSQLPEEENYSFTKAQLTARLDVAMGGRAAEEFLFGEDAVSSGAASDLESATNVARAMVMRYGMGSQLWSASEDALSGQSRLQIENDVQVLLTAAKMRALALLKSHKDELQRLAQALLDNETLTQDEIRSVLLGHRLHKKEEEVVRIQMKGGLGMPLPA